MPIAVDSALRATAAPYDHATTLRRLDLTTADASITLVSGTYDLCHDGGGLVFVRLNATAATLSAATSGAAETDGFVIPAGAVATVATDAGDLHACTASSTATLRIVRKVLA